MRNVPKDLCRVKSFDHGRKVPKVQRSAYKAYQGKDISSKGNEVSGLQEEDSGMAHPALRQV